MKQNFLKTIKGDYFEFGCGGSTIYASSLDNINKIISVENDQNWIESVQNASQKHIDFIYVDIGPIKEWGLPVDDSEADQWHKYSDAIQGYHPQAVLVDGRFRVACICQAILTIKENGLILVHDFWNREHYHAVFGFLRYT